MNTENLRNLLAQKANEIRFWTLSLVKTERREQYLCLGKKGVDVNQSRRIDAREAVLELWVKKDENTLGRAQGQINLTESLEPQLEKLIRQAHLTSEKSWAPQSFEGFGATRALRQCAPQFVEGFDRACEDLKSNLVHEIQHTKGGAFNSAELFCTLEERQRWSSNGYQNKVLLSRIYAEVCFSATLGQNSDEFLVTRWAVRPEDLSFSRMCRASVEGAEGLLQADPTPGGDYQVLLTAEDLAPILETFKERLSGSSKYLNMPFFEKGTPLIPEFSGDAFDLVINPGRDWSLNAHHADVWGLPLETLRVAHANRVEGSLYSQKFAQYLNEAPTTSGGVLEVHPERKDFDSDLNVGAALEIMQFSGLFVDAMSQTFSSEIRLARQKQKDGSVRYFKGGNLSGSLKGNFSKVCWSRHLELVSVGGEYSYFGPKAALLNDVSVS